MNLISSNKLAIIAIGRYALVLCKHVLEDKPLTHVNGVMEYIKTADPEKKFSFYEKGYLFPLIHPSNRKRVLKRYDENHKSKDKEKEFIERVQKLNK